MAILGKIDQEDSLPVLEQILMDIKRTAADDLSTDRYLRQLHVLVKLRNLGQKLEEVMETIAKFFKEEKDPLFRKGQKQGIEKGVEQERAKALQEKKEIAKTFKNLGVAIADIAKGTGLSVEEIEQL